MISCASVNERIHSSSSNCFKIVSFSFWARGSLAALGGEAQLLHFFLIFRLHFLLQVTRQRRR